MRILEAALLSFGTRGFEATSLDQIAASLEVRKQTILYWFASKEALLNGVLDLAATQLAETLEAALKETDDPWKRVEAVVRSTFGLAARKPELLGFVREMSRLNTVTSARFAEAMTPLLDRAVTYLDAQMQAGTLRRHEARFFLLSAYSMVIGVATEVELSRALGMETTLRSLIQRRNDVLTLLRNALSS